MPGKRKPWTATVDEANDGDSFITTNDEKVRIAGIDTPEKGHPGAAQAKRYLKKLIDGKKVRIIPKARDKYGRIVANVYQNGRSLRKKIKKRRFGRRK